MSRRNQPRPAKPKPGQIKVKWGVMKDCNPDICYSCGNGLPSGSARMMDSILSSKSYSPISLKWSDSPLEILEKWGFDLTTLRIEISLKDET